MFQGTVTSADGTPIAYTAWGDGAPIVIIDGATAYRAVTPENEKVGELLAGSFRVINYDRRGRGESGDTAPYAVEREFEDLAAIIAGPGEGRAATVFGWSVGGFPALNAAQAGVAIARLALFEPPAVADDARPPLPTDYVERLDAAVAAGKPGDAAELFLTAAVLMPPEFVAGVRGPAKGAGPQGRPPPTAPHRTHGGGAMSGGT